MNDRLRKVVAVAGPLVLIVVIAAIIGLNRPDQVASNARPIGGNKATPDERSVDSPTPEDPDKPRSSVADAATPRGAGVPINSPAAPGGSRSPTPGSDNASAYASAPSCSVNNVGLVPNESRSCQFKATRHGGWYYRVGISPGSLSELSVTVNREGASTTYERQGYDTTDCGNDILAPGDLIKVVLKQGSGDLNYTEVGAGEGWDCSRSNA